MADIAVVFHWSLDCMDEMSIGELLEWRCRAAERSSTKQQ